MVTIVKANLSEPSHADALIYLLDLYARDPMGGGKALDAYVKNNLAANLHARNDAHVFLAFFTSTPVGLLICIEGFSTFACQPLLNIHDVVVTSNYRGQGIAAKLLEHAEQLAKDTKCCKLTIEVLEGNRVAQSVYAKCGFGGYALDPKMGKALFWEKKL